MRVLKSKDLMIAGMVVLFGLIGFAPLSWGQDFKLGLVNDGELTPNPEAAYDWAEQNFDVQIIPIPESKEDLKEFGVVWWDESDGPSIPNAFLEQKVIDAFLGYVEDGGTLLLSSLAFHYVFEMGLQDENPRYFGTAPNNPLDTTDFRIAEGQENHPIFEGMDVQDGVIQYDILGWSQGSDFYAVAGPDDNGVLLASNIGGGLNALAEYQEGDGTIIIIGWVWSSWAINADLEDIHGPLYANILNYLASRSLFAPVDIHDKLVGTWGAVKAR